MLHEFVERGWVAVSCNYRLAPRHPWPAQIEDVVRTLAWIKRNVHDYGGDPERVVVSGGSAGGHLAALVALAGDDAAWHPDDVGEMPDLSVRGAIPFYGVLEMTGDETHWHGLGWGLRRLLEGRIVQRPFVGHEALYESLSPHHRIHEAAPPFLVIQGVERHAGGRERGARLRDALSRGGPGPRALRGAALHPARLRRDGEPAHLGDDPRGGGLRHRGREPAPAPVPSWSRATRPRPPSGSSRWTGTGVTRATSPRRSAPSAW